MNSLTYLVGLLSHYKRNDIIQGDPNEGKWEWAHYPTPKPLGGTEVVHLLRPHHQILDALRSIELGEKYFFMDALGYLPEYLVHLRPALLELHGKQMRGTTKSEGHKEAQRKVWNREKREDPKVCPHCGRESHARQGTFDRHVATCEENPDRVRLTYAHKGKPRPSTQGVPKPKIKCPHCSQEGGAHVMYRYHFDNCKHKTD